MSWLETLNTIAPTMTKAFSGPLKGAAKQFLAEKLFNSVNIDKSQIVEYIQSASPKQMSELKEFDNEFKAEMARLKVDVYRISQLDRESARKREAKAGGWSNAILAAVVIIGFFTMVGYALIKGINVNPESAALIGTLIGYVSAKADQVVSYYFGSSAGSKEKNEMFRSLK